ncbi:hypothetical protein RHS04_00486 [Rhizoctonia solani]|uniref:Uncharacterized protein n=1 Tax=Rhizoctonia solani TaxID=456999 RepID=A0A8H7HJ90_9AGAM|nr:hypothetical protein RHS04_00486 [Rhizoctonia solani]
MTDGTLQCLTATHLFPSQSVTPISPLFHPSPISLNTSLGWAPSCTTPECLPTASWSTSAINSTLSLRYWGWDVALDGHIKGNMTMELSFNGVREIWDPLGDTLFSLHGGPIDNLFQHDVTLKVLEATPNAEIIVTHARINGSTFAVGGESTHRWTIEADSDRMSYTGFAPQNTTTGVKYPTSSTIYISSRVGDMVSTQFNG